MVRALKYMGDILFKPRLYINTIWSIVSILLLAFGIVTLMFLIQPISISDVIEITLDNNGLNFLLNYLPIVLTMLVLFFAFNNILLATGIVGLIVTLLSIANRLKIILRNDPLYPWDLNLGAEFLGIATSFPSYQFVLLAFFVLFTIFITCVGFCTIKTKKIKGVYRVVFTVAIIITIHILNSTLYHNQSIINSLQVRGNVFNSVNTFNSRGFLYSFIFAHNTQRLTLPSDFNVTYINEMYSAFVPNNNVVQTPHIIMIMSEAFSEIALDDRFNFDGFRNPHYYWKQIVEKDSVIYGNIVVPHVGGGTGDAEFDALTALNTRALRGVPYSYMLVTNYFNSMPSMLNSLGYRSIAMHPGFAWFYNRQNVYRFFGFEHFYSIDYFEYYHFKGPYVSEVATMDKILDIWHRHLQDYPNTPLFNFTVTIQNHGPYASLYGLPMDYINFNTALEFNEHETSQLTNYFHGVSDNDEELWWLIQYFMHHPEPVVLLYFSDHMPGFSASIYTILYPEFEPTYSFENITRLHTVPFIIWQNYAALQITPIEYNLLDMPLPQNGIIGSNFLGAWFMQLLGIYGIDPFWDFVNILRTKFPVILEDRALSIQGEMVYDFSTSQTSDIILYRDWQFNRIFN